MQVDVINGLLGSGKTTFLQHLLKYHEKLEKVVVLVNEFGEIGIDGDLLSGQGADVVELPNGCICCSLNADLRNQIREIAENYNPERLYIEPTGIATIKNLLGILRSLSLEKYIDEIQIFLVIDASAFLEVYNQNKGYVINQIEMADVIILNKCDKISILEINRLRQMIRGINKHAKLTLTTYGKEFSSELEPDIEVAAEAMAKESIVSHEKHNQIPEIPLKKFEQFSTTSKGSFDLNKLRSLFEKLNSDEFGKVDRAKGIFFIGEKWVRLDLAAHDVNEMSLEKSYGTSKIIVIGSELEKALLKKEFRKCQVAEELL